MTKCTESVQWGWIIPTVRFLYTLSHIDVCSLYTLSTMDRSFKFWSHIKARVIGFFALYNNVDFNGTWFLVLESLKRASLPQPLPGGTNLLERTLWRKQVLEYSIHTSTCLSPDAISYTPPRGVYFSYPQRRYRRWYVIFSMSVFHKCASLYVWKGTCQRGDLRRLRRACAIAQARISFRRSHTHSKWN